MTSSPGPRQDKKSAGILLYRFRNDGLEVMIVHPGGPYWKGKDDGAWSIPKGEFSDEDPIDAARREFFEETGTHVKGDFIPLHPVKQKGGKTVYAYAVEMDLDTETIVSNSYEIEWPPRSGKVKLFPEVDKGCWFPAETAMIKLNPAQAEFVTQLEKILFQDEIIP